MSFVGAAWKEHFSHLEWLIVSRTAGISWLTFLSLKDDNGWKEQTVSTLIWILRHMCVCVCVCERESARLASVLQNHCETALHWRLLASLKLHRSVSTVEVTKNRVSSYTHTHNHKLSVTAIHTHTDSFPLCLTHIHHIRNSSAKCLTPIRHTRTHTHTHCLQPSGHLC